MSHGYGSPENVIFEKDENVIFENNDEKLVKDLSIVNATLMFEAVLNEHFGNVCVGQLNSIINIFTDETIYADAKRERFYKLLHMEQIDENIYRNIVLVGEKLTRATLRAMDMLYG